MVDIVNLRRARKSVVRKRAAAEADANRAKHGIPRSERLKGKVEAVRLLQALESKKLDSGN
ncbi:MAG: DUF4169 family protein [Alphaproteobacteria bacterium]|nr:DUF4169 family protein [Alphaproteobacteria bacterium]